MGFAASTASSAGERGTPLNPEQERAARHGAGPLLVLAGPGTGKTSALVARYRNLVKAGVPAERILAITFSRRAADQLLERIAEVTGVAPSRASVGTFHSIALWILKSYPQVFGADSRREVIEEDAAEATVAEVARELEIPSEGLLDAIEQWKDRLVSPKQAVAQAKEVEGVMRFEAMRRARAYAGYQRRLEERDLLDFADLLMITVGRMRDDKRLLASLQKRWPFLMVDEYQDINPAQDLMIRLIAGPKRNVWAVGDEDQAIYGFRGSDVRYIISFPKAYPTAGVAMLERNYRSTGRIVAVANTLIAHNCDRYGKRLVSAAGVDGERVVWHEAGNPFDEAEWILQRIEEMVEGGTKPSQIAVLTRVAHHANWLEQAFAARGLPFSLQGVTRFWDLPEVRQVLRGLARACRLDVSPDSIAPTQAVVEAAAIGSEFRTAAGAICQAVAKRPPRSAGPQRRDAWTSSISVLHKMIQSCSDAEDFVRRVTGREGVGQTAAGQGIHLGTIHAAKGLEWDAVFLAACEKGAMPHEKAITQEELEEERRLAYVAMTRARKRLFISWALERNRQERERSPYVVELFEGAATALERG